MKQRFEKYDFDVLLLEGSYVSDPNVRRAVIEDGNDRCSVEEYASRYFRRQGSPGAKTPMPTDSNPE
jgi:hypothetical protein